MYLGMYKSNSELPVQLFYIPGPRCISLRIIKALLKAGKPSSTSAKNGLALKLIYRLPHMFKASTKC